MSEQDAGQKRTSEVLANAIPSDTREGFVGHTATPWTSERQDNDDGSIYYAIHGKNYEFITNVDESAADAAFIVRACNAHDDLIETLHEVAEFLDNQSDVEDGDYGIPRPNRAMRLLIEVRNAISKATGVTHV